MADVFDGAMGMHSRHHLKTWLVKNFSRIDSPCIIKCRVFVDPITPQANKHANAGQ